MKWNGATTEYEVEGVGNYVYGQDRIADINHIPPPLHTLAYGETYLEPKKSYGKTLGI